MAENPFEEALRRLKKHFDLIKHRSADRKRGPNESMIAMKPMSAEWDKAGGDFERIMTGKGTRRRRRGRGFEGGEPVPVEPRPKPKPLMDGAEAPIE